MKTKEKAYLVGPFIGELNWELYRFSPYIIFLKKRHPDIKMIILTRESRIDLYGIYTDIFVPLKMSNDDIEKQNRFTMIDVKLEDYKKLAQKFKNKFKDQYNIVEQIYPDISMFYYKLKWQFSKFKMDYDFKPRNNNAFIVKRYLQDLEVLIDDNIESEPFLMRENWKYIRDIKTIFYNFQHSKRNSELGYLIESVKKCKFVISNFDSILSRIAVLLNIPVITCNELRCSNSIHLLNPLNVKIIELEDFKKNEDNI